MITLHQFAPAWGIPNPSPFCVKVETYLRMVKLPYRTVVTHPMKGPKRKLPFIEDQGRTIGDSTMIVSYLKATYGDPLDGDLGRNERALAHAIQRMLEEGLCWVGIFDRWFLAENWPQLRQQYFGSLPPGVRQVLPILVRRRVWRQLYGQGTGRHSADEIHQMGIADLNALSDCLGDKAFFFGEAPTSLDASAYGFLANLLQCPLGSPVKTHAMRLSNLTPYCERMTARFFADHAG